MKRIIIFLIIVFSTMNLTFANEVKELGLKKGSIYLLLLDDGAVGFKISNPNVLSFQLVTTLYNDRQQVILHPLNYGDTNFEVQTDSETYKYNFNIIDNANPLCNELFEIEKPEELSK